MRLTRSRNDQGAAIITVMLMLTLISAMLVATTTLVVKDQRARFQDHNRTETFYAAHAGLEKVTNDLWRQFSINYAPSTSDLAKVTSDPPNMGGMKFEIPGGGAKSGYTIKKIKEGEPQLIATGDFAGLHGMITTYRIDVTAKSPVGSEVSLQRDVNTIAIPVFQFGIFSETDLSFFPGPAFNFGGRVHTNGHLFLAKDGGDDNNNDGKGDNTAELILGDYVTAYKDVIRHEMANGRGTGRNDAKYDGIVRIATHEDGCLPTGTPPTTPPKEIDCRTIALTEGSLKSDTEFNTGWKDISENKYKYYLTNGANGDPDPKRPTGAGPTGAKKLVLPITSGGAAAIELIRRPGASEDTTKPELFEQRYYSMASIRILLSDTKEDLTGLAGKGPGDPENLQVTWDKTAQAGTGLPSSNTKNKELPWDHWPYTLASTKPLVDGWIKIEMQNQAGGTWKDVTAEIRGLGYSGGQLDGNNDCTGDSGAVIRIQRFRDRDLAIPDKESSESNPMPALDCSKRDSLWSNTLYDPREAEYRDNGYSGLGASRIFLGGIMHYVELDIKNLRIWLAKKRLAGEIMETTGYVVYFSDRRGNRDLAGKETGEYGYEDVIHRGNGNENPDKGEDINGNTKLETYGGKSIVEGGLVDPFKKDTLVSNWFETTDPADQTSPTVKQWIWPAEKVARASHPLFFRRALKLVNGSLDNMKHDSDTTKRLGLTVVSENPVYIQGDYNAKTPDPSNKDSMPDYGLEHVACAVIADAVTLLSNAWNDRKSFQSPHDPNGRSGNTTTFRTAIVSGKGMAFDWETGMGRDFGTDGGTHNFLRYLEGGDRTLHYRGSIVSLYYNHQATGTYKCCTNVYGAPTRKFVFDEDFLTPSLLPPRTPMFRTIDVTSFTRLSEPPPTTP
jgi:hypothetical protein